MRIDRCFTVRCRRGKKPRIKITDDTDSRVRKPIRINVRFTGPAAGMVEERIWHDSQRLEWISSDATLFEASGDGHDALVATFELCDAVEFKRWLKGFGDQAVVISPDWLREELRQELLQAAKRYSNGF